VLDMEEEEVSSHQVNAVQRLLEGERACPEYTRTLRRLRCISGTAASMAPRAAPLRKEAETKQSVLARVQAQLATLPALEGSHTSGVKLTRLREEAVAQREQAQADCAKAGRLIDAEADEKSIRRSHQARGSLLLLQRAKASMQHTAEQASPKLDIPYAQLKWILASEAKIHQELAAASAAAKAALKRRDALRSAQLAEAKSAAQLEVIAEVQELAAKGDDVPGMLASRKTALEREEASAATSVAELDEQRRKSEGVAASHQAALGALIVASAASQGPAMPNDALEAGALDATLLAEVEVSKMEHLRSMAQYEERQRLKREEQKAIGAHEAAQDLLARLEPMVENKKYYKRLREANRNNHAKRGWTAKMYGMNEEQVNELDVEDAPPAKEEEQASAYAKLSNEQWEYFSTWGTLDGMEVEVQQKREDGLGRIANRLESKRSIHRARNRWGQLQGATQYLQRLGHDKDPEQQARWEEMQQLEKDAELALQTADQQYFKQQGEIGHAKQSLWRAHGALGMLEESRKRGQRVTDNKFLTILGQIRDEAQRSQQKARDALEESTPWATMRNAARERWVNLQGAILAAPQKGGIVERLVEECRLQGELASHIALGSQGQHLRWADTGRAVQALQQARSALQGVLGSEKPEVEIFRLERAAEADVLSSEEQLDALPAEESEAVQRWHACKGAWEAALKLEEAGVPLSSERQAALQHEFEQATTRHKDEMQRSEAANTLQSKLTCARRKLQALQRIFKGRAARDGAIAKKIEEELAVMDDELKRLQEQQDSLTEAAFVVDGARQEAEEVVGALSILKGQL